MDVQNFIQFIHSEQVADYVINFKKYLNDRLDKNVCLIFDRYFQYSTKDSTRSNRTGSTN